MNALLGVGQGSVHDSRVVVMRWNGGKRGDKPIAFIGKGVCFDTGGISIKPAAGMEDMKGDMAGAACVVGLMHALAARKAKVNVVGCHRRWSRTCRTARRSGRATSSRRCRARPLRSSTPTPRAGSCWRTCCTTSTRKFKPQFMVDLATLTGAIIVALGHEYAGLFSNDDKLGGTADKGGQAKPASRSGAMPLGPEYDKMIDSKFADMKNTGGRQGGAITARAIRCSGSSTRRRGSHLDIAGTGMGLAADPTPTELGLRLRRAAARPAGGGPL